MLLSSDVCLFICICSYDILFYSTYVRQEFLKTKNNIFIVGIRLVKVPWYQQCSGSLFYGHPDAYLLSVRIENLQLL